MTATRARPVHPERPFPRIEARRLAEPGSLAGDALAGRQAADLFGSPPGVLPDEWPSSNPPVRDGIPLEAFTTTSGGAAARLDRILAGEGHLVTTGQQPGLFLGPLYTLFKALTAVGVASEVERRSGRPAMAMFWVASDDHDWDEVAACRILTVDEQLLTLRLDAPPGHAGRSVGSAPLPDAVTGLLRRFRAEAGGAVAGAPPPWLEALCEAYEPGRTFSAAFIDALAAATEGLDLAILDSAHPAVRRCAGAVYREVVDRPESITGAMERGREAVRSAGYEPALTPPAEGLQLFYDDGSARRHVLVDEGRFTDGAALDLDRAGLLDRLDAEPDAFTPAAALRPVVESRLLPVAATVLGPGEIGYWAQLRPLFASLEAAMPAIAARHAWTLVEPRVDRLLEKLDLDVATVEARGREIDARWIERSRPPGVREGLVSLEAAVDDRFAALEEAVDRELPGLRSAVGKAAHRVERALKEFGRTVDARVRERESIALDQAARVRAHLTPGGDPQERVVGAAQFLARHGRALVDDLLRAPRVAGPKGQD